MMTYYDDGSKMWEPYRYQTSSKNTHKSKLDKMRKHTFLKILDKAMDDLGADYNVTPTDLAPRNYMRGSAYINAIKLERKKLQLLLRIKIQAMELIRMRSTNEQYTFEEYEEMTDAMYSQAMHNSEARDPRMYELIFGSTRTPEARPDRGNQPRPMRQESTPATMATAQRKTPRSSNRKKNRQKKRLSKFAEAANARACPPNAHVSANNRKKKRTKQQPERTMPYPQPNVPRHNRRDQEDKPLIPDKRSMDWEL